MKHALSFADGETVLLFACVLLMFPTVRAAPFTPAHDDVVVEVLPTATSPAAGKEQRLLRGELEKDPRSLPRAVQLARSLIGSFRADGDPRHLGHAEAALAPWWGDRRPPAPVLVLRATLKQSLHDFPEALADLELLLEANPRDAQAWLTKATVLQVRGELSAARDACQPLRALASELVFTTAECGVDGLRGRAAESYARMRTCVGAHPAEPPAIRLWALTLMAELAVRLNQPAEAERHFREARALDRQDTYLLTAYADFLLDEERPEKVMQLLGDAGHNDAFLLRLALAESRMRRPPPLLAEHISALQEQAEASRARGDSVHRREEGILELDLVKDPARALELAVANWSVQREPADARLLLRAAREAQAPEAAGPVRNWITLNGVEDPALRRLVSTLDASPATAATR